MATEKNWLRHNLMDRFIDPMVDFKVEINYPGCTWADRNFKDTAILNAKIIYAHYPNLFLSFSGGADSDFVFRTLKTASVPFTPIIVKTHANKLELEYAFHTCREYNVTPVEIELSDKDYLTRYDKQVTRHINGIGIAAIPGMVACEYAKSQGGTLIIGEHMIDNDDTKIWPGMNEWDFYNEVFYGEESSIPFFNYSIHLTYAMVSAIEPTMPIAEWKHRLYGIDFRPVIPYQFNPLFTSLKNKIYMKSPKPNPSFSFESKEKLLSKLREYVIVYR